MLAKTIDVVRREDGRHLEILVGVDESLCWDDCVETISGKIKVK